MNKGIRIYHFLSLTPWKATLYDVVKHYLNVSVLKRFSTQMKGETSCPNAYFPPELPFS